MKTIILSFKLFLKKPFTNAVLAIELAVAALVVVVVGNMFQYSQSCLNVFQNSKSRMIYCSNPVPRNGDQASQRDFINSMQYVQKKYSYVKGFSDISDSFISYKKEPLEQKKGCNPWEASDVVEFDNTTISSIQLPVSKGQWLSTTQVNGKIPCVLGGKYADLYKVGDTITGYTYKDTHSNEVIQTPDLTVVGILALPQQSLDTNSSTTIQDKASNYFNDMTNREMFMIVPGSLFNGATWNNPHYGAFLYLDKSCTQVQIDAVRDELTRGYTELDTDIIAAEKKDIGQTLDVMMPFLIVLFLVIFMGLIAVCMLTAMKNMHTFKIYYLTGCPRRKILLMMLFYVFYFFIISSVLFTILLQCGKNMVHQLRMLEAYFILQPTNFISISLLCAVVSTCSIVIPLILIKKNDLSDLLRKN